MPCQLSLNQLSEIINPVGLKQKGENWDQIATGITTDSRSLKPGEIFVALRGEKFDGHEFVGKAVGSGAIAVIAGKDYHLDLGTSVLCFLVDDPLEAYQQIARWWRDRFDIPVIGITGSVGKTTTKELIAAVLATQGKVLKSQANYNNEIGVPKTLLELDADCDFAVVEMAMRARGEIALLTQIARPTIGVITNVGTAHIGRLGSEEAIAQAKCELLAEMSEENVAILNHDNQRLLTTAATIWQGKTLTYGLEGGDIQGKILNQEMLQVGGINLPLPLPGRHNALNYLAALAVAKVLNIDWNQLTTGLSVNLPGGRSRRYNLANDIVVLDETYNAGTESTIAALHLLKETPGKRHIAVLGTMKELGAMSAELHQKVGETAEKLNLEAIFLLIDDPEAKAIATGAQNIPCEGYTTHEEMTARLKDFVQPGDRLLFKASNSVRLDRVVEQFCSQLKLTNQHPEN
ncbi:MAG: UDP-N-acetylmuramoyl-tripeptide--D-alanyl-D-alanine ligase [Oscillatoria sp. PMC 1068.18]|nr:UDP-N-acetylmuramoyl-tripeptide--D-alanyl-D-alanine ligase [Oscillatoria sp. PMC 1076.18]MEC4988738.1 UDP-N-acetylmuramoyl-tripeptide--D-alanyl-D-alanine ligase [Oscillatoria sp. PMC 1068.18]